MQAGEPWHPSNFDNQWTIFHPIVIQIHSMPDVLHKRPRKFFTRREKVAGALRAGSLGDVVAPSSKDWRKHYACTPQARHEHQWLKGTQNAVCSVCGKTVSHQELSLLTPRDSGSTRATGPSVQEGAT
jgi:hypothetical protein